MNKLMIVQDKKKSVIIEKFGENLSIKFLKKRMKKLNDELGFMSGFLCRLRVKINQEVKLDSWSSEEKNQDHFRSGSTKPVQSRSGVYS